MIYIVCFIFPFESISVLLNILKYFDNICKIIPKTHITSYYTYILNNIKVNL